MLVIYMAMQENGMRGSRWHLIVVLYNLCYSVQQDASHLTVQFCYGNIN